MAEKEYIERGALAEEIDSLSVIVTGIRCGKGYLKEIVEHYKNSIDRIINEQPAADVAEVRHGTWTLHSDGSGTCSECGFTQKNVWDYDNQQRFCGVCGAKMDGGAE